MTNSNVRWSNPFWLSVNNSYVEVRKVNILTQTGCLSSIEVETFYTFSENSPSYTFPDEEYESLYVAKVFWLDNSYNVYYLNNTECYFLPQRRKYITCIHN